MIFPDFGEVCYPQKIIMKEMLFYHVIAVAGHGNYHKIKKYRGGAASWEEAYHVLRERGVPMPDPREEYEQLDRLGVRIALAGTKEYPEALRHIPHPPFGIYLRGGTLTISFASSAPTIAVVGTRRASAEGKKTARRFARELTAAGCTIASGLAFGIDAAAHEGALDAGGATVAVLAGGLDNVYPESHSALARRLLENGGTLISEYPPGEEPFGYRFIERNRIISGISRGVLIVEAPESSGALATARYAAEQNREVFVVPGAVTATNFKGSHALIRQGAELVTSADDILEAYDVDKKENVATCAGGSSAEETLILKVLASTSSPTDVDKLIALTKLEPRMVNQALSFLLIRGMVKESDTGYTI
jgi:DNA processing protein